MGLKKNAIGKEIEISKRRRGMNLSYRVVGVFRNPLESFIRVMKTGFFPRFARIPYQNYNYVFDKGSGVFTDILIEAKNPENLGQEMEEAKNYLEQKNQIQNIYTTRTVASDTESFDQILSTLNIFYHLCLCNFFVCRRNWSDEYHAGDCGGKNKRNWNPKIFRGHESRHFNSIFSGSSDTNRYGRIDWFDPGIFY